MNEFLHISILTICFCGLSGQASDTMPSAFQLAVRKIQADMTRNQVEEILKPAEDTGMISMFSGGQISEYKCNTGEEVAICYDYHGSEKGEDGWLTNRKNPDNKVISVLLNGELLVGNAVNNVRKLKPKDE